MHKDEETLVEAGSTPTTAESTEQVQFVCADCGYSGPLDTFINAKLGMKCPKCESTNLLIK